MTRAQEWADLLALEPPARLMDTVDRALRRREQEQEKKNRRKALLARWNRRLAPAYALAGAVCAFVLVVNLSVPFALACGQLPGLKAAVTAVAFDPTLKAALKSDYYQILEGTYTTEEGVEFKPYCLMASDQRVSLLCAFNKGVAEPILTDEAGEQLGYCTFYPESGDMVLSNFDLIDQELPEKLTFTYSFFDGGRVGEPLSAHTGEEWGEITFTVPVDERFRRAKREVALGTTFTLDGQTLTAEKLILTPIASQIVFSGDENNTADLKSLSFYLEDEKGRQYTWTGTMSQGSGNPHFAQDGGEFVGNYRFSGLYDVDFEHLTLHITATQWLTRDRPDTVLHLDTGKAKHLPEYVQDWWWEDGSGTESALHEVDPLGAWRGLHFYTNVDLPSIPFVADFDNDFSKRTPSWDTPDPPNPLHFIEKVEGDPGDTITFRVHYDSYTTGRDVAIELK